LEAVAGFIFEGSLKVPSIDRQEVSQHIAREIRDLQRERQRTRRRTCTYPRAGGDREPFSRGAACPSNLETARFPKKTCAGGSLPGKDLKREGESEGKKKQFKIKEETLA